jgi:hypothetical protein
MSSSTQEIIQELKERMPALASWSYIALWTFAEMFQKMKQSPDSPHFEEIRFPHTQVPIFTKDQASNLENQFRTYIPIQSQGQKGGKQGKRNSQTPSIFQVLDRRQTGGSQNGGGLGNIKKTLQKVGSAVGTVVGDMNPDVFSLDKQFQTFTNTLDAVDAEVTDFSKQYGLMALESVAPDPKFVIPIGPVPIPVIIPVKLVLPAINAILELLRILGPKIPIIGSSLQGPLSILLALLDLARGNFYHSIFSFIGIFGKSPMYAGIILKIARDAFVLISPNIRTELRTALFKSSKSFVIGFFFWLFTTVSPEIIRIPIVKLLDTVRAVVESFNAKMETLSQKATLALKGVGRVEFPQLPSEKIPSFSDLYIIQEYIQMPQVYCHPEVDALIQQMRSIPPLALFFDLLNIPLKTSEEWQRVCAKIESTPLADFLKPKVEITGFPTPTAPPVNS